MLTSNKHINDHCTPTNSYIHTGEQYCSAGPECIRLEVNIATVDTRLLNGPLVSITPISTQLNIYFLDLNQSIDNPNVDKVKY